MEASEKHQLDSTESRNHGKDNASLVLSSQVYEGVEHADRGVCY